MWAVLIRKITATSGSALTRGYYVSRGLRFNTLRVFSPSASSLGKTDTFSFVILNFSLPNRTLPLSQSFTSLIVYQWFPKGFGYLESIFGFKVLSLPTASRSLMFIPHQVSPLQNSAGWSTRPSRWPVQNKRWTQESEWVSASGGNWETWTILELSV